MPSTSATGASGSGRSHAIAAPNETKTAMLTRMARATGRRTTTMRTAAAKAVACDASGCKISNTAHAAQESHIQDPSRTRAASATTKAGSSNAATFAWTGPMSIQRCTPASPGLARLASNPTGAAKGTARPNGGEAKRETASAMTAPTPHAARLSDHAPAELSLMATTRQPAATATNDATAKTARNRSG